jgi:hypothetical protein
MRASARRWVISAGGLPQAFSGPGSTVWAAALSRLGESMEFMRKLETQTAISASAARYLNSSS